MPILPELMEIKLLRRKLNINQKDFEKDLKIPQATISRIENGRGNPSYFTVKRIFKYLEDKRTERENPERKAENIMSKKIISIDSQSSIKEAVGLMNRHNVSQIPILENNQYIGSITAKKIQKFITDNSELINAKVDIIKALPFPEIEKDGDIKKISKLLLNYPAVLVKDFNEYIGIITDADLLKFV